MMTLFAPGPLIWLGRSLSDWRPMWQRVPLVTRYGTTKYTLVAIKRPWTTRYGANA